MPELVLITGVTGQVGSAIMIKALKDGYAVRAAVRSLGSKDKILNVPVIKNNGLGEHLTFVEVPDIEAAGAYDEAIKGVDYVIHVASPLTSAQTLGPDADFDKLVVQPAVRGTLNMLEAALSNPSTKRVVVTSSVASNMVPDGSCKGTNPRTRRPVPAIKDWMTAYYASKHAALLESDKFMEEKNPQFDLINIHPAFVIGRKELATSPKEALGGTNMMALEIAFQGVVPRTINGTTVSLEDTAFVHVEALKLPGKENRGFGVSKDYDPNDVFPILKKHFPKLVEMGVLKEPVGVQKFHCLDWDSSETEKVFGMKFQPIEEQIVPVIQHFLELKSKAG